MSGQYQFPPSSPNLGVEGIYPKEELKQLPQDIMHIPTPNPSSSIGLRSSSPVRGDKIDQLASSPLRANEAREPASPSPKHKGVKILDPLDSVHHLKLPSDGSIVYLGRSSKSCNFPLDPHNKRISRVHLKIKYITDTKQVEIRCIGWNGINISIPSRINVKLKEDKDYVVEPSRIIAKENRLTNFYILKDESIVMPQLEGVLMDLSGELILLEYENVDDLTDNEEHDVFVRQTSREPAPAPAVAAPVEPMTPVKHAKIAVTSSSVSAPTASSTPKREPLKSASESKLNIPRQNKPKPTGPSKKRRRSEGLYDNITQEEIDRVMSTIPDLQQVENVLVNHLAFSRLSSTPLSTVKSISHSTEDLTDEQLRILLIKHVECVGVIYRIGKDAAGKPLDEEYYYVPEKDSNLGRTQLVANLKGESGGLRSCRKTHKQYFWRKPAKK